MSTTHIVFMMKSSSDWLVMLANRAPQSVQYVSADVCVIVPPSEKWYSLSLNPIHSVQAAVKDIQSHLPFNSNVYVIAAFSSLVSIILHLSICQMVVRNSKTVLPLCGLALSHFVEYICLTFKPLVKTWQNALINTEI